MDEARKRAFGVFLAEDFQGIGFRVAGMHDDRQAGFPRGLQVGAETDFLAFPRAVFVIIVEPGFAEADDLGVSGQFDQLGRRGFGLAAGFVRMDADGAEDVIEPFGHRQHLRKLAEVGADGQHDPYPRLAGAADDRVEFVGEIWEIEMAVTVDEHCSVFIY